MIITHSSMECFKSCRNKFKLRYIDCIVPKVKSNALDFGSAMHASLEHYFNLIKDYQESPHDYSDDDLKEILLRECPEIGYSYLPDETEQAKLCGLIIGYINNYYPGDKQEFSVFGVEQEFSIPLTSPSKMFKSFLSGKIDGIIQRKSDGKYYILEHKTASIVDDAYVSQKSIDSQTMLYASCIHHTHGIKISGAIHDIITKQKIRQKKGESPEEFRERLISDVTNENFTRIEVEFSDEQMDEFEQDLESAIDDITFCDRYYKCTGSCIGRYGACEYLPICKSGGLVDAVKEMYEIRRAHEELSDETVGEEAS